MLLPGASSPLSRVLVSATLPYVVLSRSAGVRRVKGNLVSVWLNRIQAGPSQLSRLAQRPLREEGWPLLPNAVEGKANWNQSRSMLVENFSTVVSSFRGFLGRRWLALETSLMRRDDLPIRSSSERLPNISECIDGQKVC